MRRKAGVPTKETAKQKKERKQEFAKSRQQLSTIVLPTIAIIFIFICLYVFFKTRPPKVNLE